MKQTTLEESRELIPVSALNQCAYCPHRCYLIHAEGEFEDNIHTQRGSSEHERVDEEASRTLARIFHE